MAATRHHASIACLWEPLVIRPRGCAALGLPGMSVDTVRGFRDKQLMKERVAAAGLRVPRSRACDRQGGARGRSRHRLPAIVKPIGGAGSADTYKVDVGAELERVLPQMQHVHRGELRGVHRRRGVHLRHGLHRRQARLRERRAVPAEAARDALARVGVARS